ncbi:type I-E CRISPR-associated protein Cse2/CasB [Streptosporangium saharense]|uniref:type I-E CRISPR-associated protein Cse2/CasB n=1 Tax=Streptosporangium saharense TaxID=1706840 RepID=UPI0036B30B70
MSLPEEEAPQEKTPEQRLVRWLAGLVLSHDVGALADLRRSRADTLTRLRAGNFAYDTPDAIPLFEWVAFQFARFHAGQSVPHYGWDNLGRAMRNIGGRTSRGPDNDGCVRLLNQILVSRQPPWKRIQHAIDQLRADRAAPPSWEKLAVDLGRWTAPQRVVQHAWAHDFYIPPKTSKARRNP